MRRFAKTEIRDGSVPPVTYLSTPPYRVYAKNMTTHDVLRLTSHGTLAEAVAELARFQLPFIPWRAAGVFDIEHQLVLSYIATDTLDLSGTDEAFVELAKHRPPDEVALWQAEATLATTLPVWEEGAAWSPST